MNFASIQFFFSRFLQRDAQQKLNDSFREPPQTDKVQCYETTTMKYLGYFPALKPGEDIVEGLSMIFQRVQDHYIGCVTIYNGEYLGE
ncbi:aldehyde dehydrogenase 22A1-like isoform X2 [Olea europaea var. sylvestris]|uniref:aldehyde dehydrogenase 22A1-like isoform X2 n=1 Tax=Olea europaea var. sylvestris TaxID=158386 RepID=UPI000C1D4012|nr:aldehyde dehydrogenase 22A1-like isoform X2 [Olea europaea var. sylvestris]